MGSKRCYFGTLPLWSHARRVTPSEERGNAVDVAVGVDQPRALFIPASENVSGGVDVVTWAAPNQSQDDQEGFNATKAAIKAALRARYPYGLPLVWNADDSLDRVLASGAGDTYVFSTPHAFAVGALLYFVRPSVGTDRGALLAFGWARVLSIPSALEVTLDADPSTDDYAPTLGDRVIRASSLWSPLYATGAPQFAMAKTGDHYSPEVTWRFVGSPSVELHATAAAITSLPT